MSEVRALFYSIQNIILLEKLRIFKLSRRISVYPMSRYTFLKQTKRTQGKINESNFSEEPQLVKRRKWEGKPQTGRFTQYTVMTRD